MIEIRDHQLIFTFPEIHPQAKLTIELQRTLRISDDDQDYPLPPGLAVFHFTMWMTMRERFRTHGLNMAG